MRWMLVTGAVFGALAVMTGAFGAHALQGLLDERALAWYDTAVTYQARHAIALVACGLLAGRQPGRALTAAAVCLVLGTLVFSGSLYLMAFSGWTRAGMITPLGGALLITGWIALAVAAARLPAPGAHPAPR